MQILNVQQGTAEWLALRPKYCVASEAPVIMGDGRHTARNELIRMKRTGDEREFSKWEQESLLAKGHRAEAAARDRIEALTGDSFPPVVGVSDCGRYLASFDGLSGDCSTVFEAKLWNAGLAESIRAGDIPPAYYWQLEHQIMVAGAETAIFCCCSEDGEEMEWTIYQPVAGRRAQLVAGWDIFLADLAAWEPAAGPAPSAPIVAEKPAALPALMVELQGRVVSSNIAAWSEIVAARIAGINTNLQTDEDFAGAQEMVGFLADAEARVEAVKAAALAQTSTIDELFRTLDSLREQMRAKRLTLTNTVEARKKRIREEVLAGAITEFNDFMREARDGLPARFDFRVVCDIASAMKGKRNIATLKEAAAACVAKAKISVAEAAGRARANLAALREIGAGRSVAAMFPDIHELLHKAPDDFSAVARLRIAEADAEAARAAARAAEASQPPQEAPQAAAQVAPQATADPQPQEAPQGGVAFACAYAPAPAGPAAPAIDCDGLRREIWNLLTAATGPQLVEIRTGVRAVLDGEPF